MFSRFLALAFAFLPAAAMAEESRHTITNHTPDRFDVVRYEDGRLLAAWLTGDHSEPQTQIMAAHYAPEYGRWFGPKPLIRDGETVTDVVLHYDAAATRLWLFTAEQTASGTYTLRSRQSERGVQWTGPDTLVESVGKLRLGSAAQNGETIKLGFAAPAENGVAPHVVTWDGATWSTAAFTTFPSPASPPILVAHKESFLAYAATAALPHRYMFAPLSDDAPRWVASNLPYADSTPTLSASLRNDAGRLLTLARLDVLRPERIALAASYDGGRTWPLRRTVAEDAAEQVPPRLLSADDDALHLLYLSREDGLVHRIVEKAWLNAPMTLDSPPTLATVAPPLDYDGHFNRPEGAQIPLPVTDAIFFEHVRQDATDADWDSATKPAVPDAIDRIDAVPTTPIVQQGDQEWLGTEDGLYTRNNADDWQRHPHYGYDGPLANRITGLGVDEDARLWVATLGGLSVRDNAGAWRLMRGQEGLPWPELTALTIDRLGRVWLGSTRGLIIHDPDHEDRPWYYRQGERYLPGDHIEALYVAEDGRSALLKTNNGIGRLVEEAITLHDKASFLEAKYNARHRRLGLASPARYEDPYARDAWTHGPQPSDGLWTSYHVTATALAYSLSLEPDYRESAAESMEAMYLLQTVTGIPGLVARTVVSVDEPAAEQFRDADNYHLTADGRYLWRDDVSSDQLDGHFLAFYTWFEHIAQFDPNARARAEDQVRLVIDYILDNNYTIPDWSGERTEWGWWTPELLNEAPIHFQEVGIYSLMMLSFLKVAWYITEEERYAEHYRELIEEHDFLSNVLLEKKLFPDELNHSDDQLSAVAYYPILQLEHDPFIRDALHRGIRRHAKVEVAERNSLFALVYATIDRHDADIEGAVRTLREMPRDRRNWAQHNSHRHDVALWPGTNRGGDPVLVEVLPYDEHHFERWNQDPYVPDSAGNGTLDGSGEHYLIPYWIGRFHHLIGAP